MGMKICFSRSSATTVTAFALWSKSRRRNDYLIQEKHLWTKRLYLHWPILFNRFKFSIHKIKQIPFFFPKLINMVFNLNWWNILLLATFLKRFIMIRIIIKSVSNLINRVKFFFTRLHILINSWSFAILNIRRSSGVALASGITLPT